MNTTNTIHTDITNSFFLSFVHILYLRNGCEFQFEFVDLLLLFLHSFKRCFFFFSFAQLFFFSVHCFFRSLFSRYWIWFLVVTVSSSTTSLSFSFRYVAVVVVFFLSRVRLIFLFFDEFQSHTELVRLHDIEMADWLLLYFILFAATLFLALSFSLCILSIEMLHSFLIFVVCFFHSRLRFAITNFVLPNRIYWHFIIIIMKYERQWDAVFRTTATKAVFAVIFSVRFDSKAEQQQQQRKTVRPSTKWKNRFAFHWISIWANFVAKIHNFPLFQLKFIDALVIYIANEAAKKSIKYGILNRWMELLIDNWTKYKLKIGWLLLVSVFPPHRHF